MKDNVIKFRPRKEAEIKKVNDDYSLEDIISKFDNDIVKDLDSTDYQYEKEDYNSFMDFFEREFNINLDHNVIRTTYYIFDCPSEKSLFKLFKLEEVKDPTEGYVSISSSWGKWDDESMFYEWQDDDFIFDEYLLTYGFVEYTELKDVIDHFKRSDRPEDKLALDRLVDNLIYG